MTVIDLDKKEQASKLAGQGCIRSRSTSTRVKVATAPELAHEISPGVPDDCAKRDLHAAFEFLQGRAEGEKRSPGCDLVGVWTEVTRWSERGKKLR
jgi:hypothetical protein